MKNKHVLFGVGITTCVALATLWQSEKGGLARSLNDEALLSIIKNDQKGFEKYLSAGGKLDSKIQVEGHDYRVSELLVKYERVNFIKYVSDQKIELKSPASGSSDVWTLAVTKNNPDILKALIHSNPGHKLNSKSYGPDQRNLLHLASAQCSYKVVDLLHQSGMNWSDKDKKGATPLTLAADHDCLQILSYWKEKGADFKAYDGRGESGLTILQKKQDAAVKAFAQSFAEKRTTIILAQASAPHIPHFYRKRVIPKDNLADRAHLIEPEDRPDEANETSELSEFSD